MSGDRDFDTAEAHRRLSNIVRRGLISAVQGATARVRLDADWETDFLPVRQVHAGRFKSWSAPVVGEQVDVFSLSGEVEAGVILRGLNSDAHAPPSTDPDVEVLGSAAGYLDTFNHATGAREIALSPTGRFAVTVGNASLVMLADQVAISLGASKVILTAAGVETVGPTRLNGGSRPVVFQGSQDSHGDTNLQGEPEVLV